MRVERTGCEPFLVWEREDLDHALHQVQTVKDENLRHGWAEVAAMIASKLERVE